ncbi:BREX-1 system adenine-specific DNA-methyltransferase PglX [Fundicoccus ignavus]|uniref:site-specific DNA-methyltransferase (adenine-specific) n=1 Tax=Fundicoccus ignavus TaxID=2664442 RepID=A0A844C2Y8_9LACT|nr:BREX-1 system adenine-specific DNA-methyltransferase PglX [Fundicoccus ignavus]MRJ47472.1 BREX-1 system adenine-specific DNA-methyltransferase PglX [Fundicoccus ignavus]
MNQGKLKTFAVEARRELLEKVALQARKIGVTEDSINEATVESSDALIINGQHLSKEERVQRNKLIRRIEETSFEQVMEEAAYTWFNRFVALRFMEVNDYLPTRVRVLSSLDGGNEPDMMKEALSLGLDVDTEKVYEMKLNNQDDELFKYLIIAHCNDLNDYLPFMFGTIEDYTEILFPEGLLNTDSFVRKMTNTEVFPEDDWYEVEIIGWLYQYYISEEKDQIFTDLKKNIKITQDTLPAATQIFTPNWIVRYLVENSLGKVWMESNPDSNLKDNWRYYLPDVEQSVETLSILNDIKYQNATPEEITIFDPSCGSGHILIYAFDLLYDFYIEKGYLSREIPTLILMNNIYGLDIDNRAAQLASFALMMKAREKDSRIFRKQLTPNIYSIEESNWLTDDLIEKISNNDSEVKQDLTLLKNTFIDAKEYGSLLKIEPINEVKIFNSLDKYLSKDSNLFEFDEKDLVRENLPKLVNQASLLSKKYDVACTNPPYMGRSSMNTQVTKFLDKNFKNTKSDLFAAFMERNFGFIKENGFNSIVTMQSWMFLSSYEKLRIKLLNNKTIYSLLHMDNMVMGIAFGTSATIFRNHHLNEYIGNYSEVKNVDIKDGRPIEFPVIRNRNNNISAKEFIQLPGNPISYWASDNLISNFLEGDRLVDLITPKQGLATADNNRFLRLWWETNYNQIKFNTKSVDESKNSGYKWVPYNKGGKRRQWYGNYDYLINWENDGEEIRNFTDSKGKQRSVVRSPQYYFKEAITWSDITSGKFAIRYREPGSIHDVKGMSAFSEDKSLLKYILGITSTKIADYIFDMINPTISLQIGNFSSFPVMIEEKYKDEVIDLVEQAIKMAKFDWDSFETSWDFKMNPLITLLKTNRNEATHNSRKVEDVYYSYKNKTNNLFEDLKKIETDLNRDFIEIYDLHDDVRSKVSDRDITVAKIYDEAKDISAEIKGNQYVLTKKDVIQQFISYAIGCMFGRYSLDEEGLIYAGGEFDASRYETYDVVEDNIIPITSDVYLEDDLVNRFVEFVETVYSKETLEENLNFIAEALGQKKNETARDTIHSYFLKDFFKDHAKMYSVTGSGRRPIYWKFTSGKENAFNCFIYMHRYDKTTISRIRTEYLHDVQQRLETRKVDLDQIINSDASATELNKARKEMKTVEKQLAELIAYDEKLRHMADQQIEIDLNDGFNVNYPKFKGLVEKV